MNRAHRRQAAQVGPNSPVIKAAKITSGKPLQQHEKHLFFRSGEHVGRIRSRKVFAPDGKYAGTIVGNRVVHRSTDSAEVTRPFAQTAPAGTAAANAAPSAVWGDEPPVPD
jgi:hypothetical protein